MNKDLCEICFDNIKKNIDLYAIAPDLLVWRIEHADGNKDCQNKFIQWFSSINNMRKVIMNPSFSQTQTQQEPISEMGQ